MEVKNFKINIERKRMAQDFNKEEITVTKAGKEINVYNFIQESREDTEIYPTLEKYGCIDRMVINEPDVYSDLRNIKDLRNSLICIFYLRSFFQVLFGFRCFFGCVS